MDASPTAALRVEGLTRRFRGLVALDSIDLAVAPGETLGVIGPNGSGKTTLFNVIVGLYPPTAGRVLLDDADIGGLAPWRIARRGVARTFQNLRLHARLTVLDTVWAALGAGRPAGLDELMGAFGSRRQQERVRAEALLETTGLIARRDDLAGSLPLAEQRRLELARALARSPRLLLLDEPAGGMTPAETAAMAGLIREHALPGRTCIVIEHKMDLIAALSDRIAVLNFGRKIAEGDPAAVLRHPEVLTAYLGAEDDDAAG